LKVRVPLVLLGCGRVGQALLEEAASLDLQFLGVLDSTGGVVDGGGIPQGRLSQLLSRKREGVALGELGVPGEGATSALLALLRERRGLLVDVTAADTRPFLFSALEAGWGVVLANKLPLVGPWEDFRRLSSVGYEATVGAGIPLITTLKALLGSGDEVHLIQGGLSGTLGFLLAEVERGEAFSQAVRRAMARGYTEPHPAEDLSGADLARKGLILARTLGLPLELEEVELEPLASPAGRGLPVEGFLQGLRAQDAELRRRLEGAKRRGLTLRYVVEVSSAGVRAGLREVDRKSPLARAQGVENVVVINTRRFKGHPLVLAGPGAGPASTCAGLLLDIFRLARTLGR